MPKTREDTQHRDDESPAPRGVRGRIRDALRTIKASAMAAVNADPGEDVLGADRVMIGCNYVKQPAWKIAAGVPLIYIPVLTTVPFLIPAVVLMKAHLRMVGGMNIKSYWDFVPEWVTHRYDYHTQIVCRETRVPIVAQLTKAKVFWLFNCKLYCPLSVGLLGYSTYLVKIVENFWCPFNHGMKHTYADGAIDKSFWAATGEGDQLHPEDAVNPIWNRDAAGSAGSR